MLSNGAGKSEAVVKKFFRGMALGLAGVLLTIQSLTAQTAEAVAPSETRDWFSAWLRFAVAEPVEDAELDRLAGLWHDATDAARADSARQGSLRRLLDDLLRMQGAPDGRYTAANLDAMAQRAGEVIGLRAPPPVIPDATADTAAGRVESVGRGPVPLVLVGDFDYDASIYEAFMTANEERFTMHAVSLPGTGGTAPPRLPERGSYSATNWLNEAERLLLDRIEERGLERPVLVGSFGSGPLVARMAVAHPERFRAAVVLHGLVFQPFPSPSAPAAAITAEELRARFDGTLPPLFPAPSIESVRASYLSAAGAFVRDSIAARELALDAARVHPNIVAHYRNEAGTVDLRTVLGRLRIPMLAIPSIHDGASPAQGSELWAGQWYQAKLDHPGIPLRVVLFKGTRNYVAVDRPEELGAAIADFLAGQNVAGPLEDPADAAYFVSPRAITTQVVGGTEVTVKYYSPAVNGREIWGGLVPYDAVWRAGANAATTVSFSRAVEIEGQPLDAGQYTFFVIPREDRPWTLIFNRVPVQFGNFFRRAEHDALRLEVVPEEAPHEEHLRYRILPIQPVEAQFEMHWGTRKASLHVVAAEGAGMTRTAAVSPGRFRTMDWNLLATDPADDGARPQSADGIGVAYTHDALTDTLWFRIDLQDAPNPRALGINLVVDTDQDPGTGSAWWGGNTDFSFDRVATVWVMQARSGFWGTIGVSGHVEALAGDYTALGSGNLALSADTDRKALYVGVAASDLDDDGAMRLLVAVGSNTTWNDNLPDTAGVVLDLRR